MQSLYDKPVRAFGGIAILEQMKRWYTDEVIDEDEYIKRLQIENLELANKGLKAKNKLIWILVSIIGTIIAAIIIALLLDILQVNIR